MLFFLSNDLDGGNIFDRCFLKINLSCQPFDSLDNDVKIWHSLANLASNLIICVNNFMPRIVVAAAKTANIGAAYNPSSFR